MRSQGRLSSFFSVCPILLLIVVGVCVAVGCRESKPRPAAQYLDADEYGKLPGLSKTTDKKLREELARVIDEAGTPELLDAKAGVPDASDVPTDLKDMFSAQTIGSVLKKSAEIFPPKTFTFNPLRLEKAIKFLARYQDKLEQAREVFARRQCDFGFRHQRGCMNDMTFIDTVVICSRLEAFSAAESLSKDDVVGAIGPLKSMLRMADCLGRVKNVSTRLEAAYIRSDALKVMRAIIENPRAGRTQYGQILQLVETQLSEWPSDADVWIADRAMGMHTYEVVRVGNIVSLLTLDEMEAFVADDSIANFAAASQRTVDQDEKYYLDAMRKIIASCDDPYFKRIPLFDKIQMDLQRKRNTAEFPLVAGRMLLIDMQSGHEIMARDRANYEAWALALAQAIGKPLPSYRVNPLTGEKYRITKKDGVVVVRNVETGEKGDNSAIVVPDVSKR